MLKSMTLVVSVFAALFVGAVPAQAAPHSSITCVTVRYFVNLLGVARAEAAARQRGATDADVSRAKSCLFNRKRK